MTKKLLFVVLIALVASIALMAADVSGKWTFEQQGRNGSQTVTLNLKADGGTLTGTVSGGMGRGGNAEQDISDGKVDGNNISFAVKREFNGTVDGDTIKLDVTRPGRGGGDPVTTSVTAKRATT
jgi:phage head maturation protease